MIEGLASRDAALASLLEYASHGTFVSESLNRHARGLSSRDRGLALESALSAIRWKSRLDHHLSRFLRGSTQEPILWLLRLGVAQGMILDRIPPHAVVHLSVELAHRHFGRGAAGLVNAVMRRSLENPWDDPQGDDPKALAVRWSHPEWLVQRWVKRHGPEIARAMLEAGSRDPDVWVRVRPGTTQLPWDPSAEVETAHGGFFRKVTASRERILGSDAFLQGMVSFQDPSSGACALSLADHLRPGMALVDLCAAPGGKLACLHDHGDLDGVRSLALDSSWIRQTRTQDGFRRLGMDSTLVAVSDGTQPPLREGSVDAVLVDAPCSNLGVLSRRPEARWHTKPDEPRHAAKLQRRLVESMVPCLKPGGRLAYSVCSTEPEEGEGVVADLPGTVLESSSTRLPGMQQGDGFFLAVLRRL